MAKTILERTAEAVFRADEAPKKAVWSQLPRPEQRRYEVMAAAALSVALRLSIDEEVSVVETLLAPETHESAAPAKTSAA